MKIRLEKEIILGRSKIAFEIKKENIKAIKMG
jgi:hypothetical protein